MVENRSRRAPTPICVQRPRGPKSRGRVNACPVAPSLSATLPDRAPARASTADPVYRWSKIGRVARPRQHACNDRRGRNLKVRQPARAIAPSLSQTVRRLAQAPPTPFSDGRKSVASRAHANMRAMTDGAEIPRSGKRLPRRAIALATLADRAPARASTADPVSRWSKIGHVARPRQHACNDRGGRNLKVR